MDAGPVHDGAGVRVFLTYHDLPGERDMKKFIEFLKKEDGPTAVEYAVMLALIIVVCLTTIAAVGTNANVTFDSVSTKLAAS